MARPTKLTKELTSEIKKLVLAGHQYQQCQEILDIPSSTWDMWVHENYKGFRGLLSDLKKERMVKKAEVKTETLIDSEDEKVATSNAHFILKTLGKEEGYSEKHEHEHKGEVIFTIAKEIAEKNGITPDTEESSPESEEV